MLIAWISVCAYCQGNNLVRRATAPHTVAGAAQVSSVEQEVCCSAGNLSGHHDAVRGLLGSPNITDEDRCAASHFMDGQHRMAPSRALCTRWRGSCTHPAVHQIHWYSEFSIGCSE